jgi:hypothetical protein
MGHWALGIEDDEGDGGDVNTARFVHFQLGIWFWEKVKG